MSDVPQWRTQAKPGLSLLAARQMAQSTAPNAMPLSLDRILRPEVQKNWAILLARQYTPERVEWVLRNGLAGDHANEWELFRMMEDTWPRLAKNILEIKRSVRGLEWCVEPWAEEEEAPTPEAVAHSKIVSKALTEMNPRADEAENGFGGTIEDLMDAWAKGVAVVEVDWEWRNDAALGRFLAPRATRFVKPNCYAWSPDGQWLGLRTDAMAGSTGQGGLVRFQPYKFLIAIAKARAGHPLGSALLRPLAFWWCAANFTAEWFLNFAQIFGVPIRWGTYDPSVPGLDEKVAAMLEQMGSSAWAAFPAGTTLEIKEPARSGADNPQVLLMDRADKYCDLLILGQTLTTDVNSTGSRALGTVHEGVRQEIIMAAAEWMEDLLRDQLVKAICKLNWGSDTQCPTLEAKPHKAEDETAMATRDATLIGAGVPLPLPWLLKRHKIPMATEGEAVVTKPEPPPMPNLPPLAAARSLARLPDPVEAVVQARKVALGKAYSGAMAPFREAILASASREDCLARLRALYQDWAPGRLEAELETALQLCAAKGCGLEG